MTADRGGGLVTGVPSEGATGAPTTGLGGLSVPLGVHVDAVSAERTLRLEAETAHLHALADERDKRYCERNRRQDDAMKHMEAISEQARKDDKEAVHTAFAASTELAKSHNDLLRKMEKLTETFATREGTVELLDRHEKAFDDRLRRMESFQNKLLGALVVVSFLVTGNFVEVWL